MLTTTDNNKSKSDTEEYRRAFRKQVFQLIKWGYEQIDAASFSVAEEEEITGELVKTLDEITQNRSFPRWVGNMYVGEESHVNINGRRGKRRQRIDIEFIRVQYGPRPRFYFEAKRLSAGTHATVGKYLGSEGLGEFLAGNYGYDVNEAGMLAYIQSNTLEYWAKKISTRLHDEKDNFQLLAGSSWVVAKIIIELHNCYKTIHNRSKGLSPITIYHCLLGFIP